MTRQQHAELAAAIADRPDWTLTPYREWGWNEPARYLPENRRMVWGQVFGPGNERDEGWVWSVWEAHNAVRSLRQCEPQRTAAAAVAAVERCIAQVLAERES